MSKQICGQWCILLGLLLFIFVIHTDNKLFNRKPFMFYFHIKKLHAREHSSIPEEFGSEENCTPERGVGTPLKMISDSMWGRGGMQNCVHPHIVESHKLQELQTGDMYNLFLDPFKK